jgi:hypothetical protein
MAENAAAPPAPGGAKRKGHGRGKSISSRIIEGARDELVQKFLSGEHCGLHPHQRVCLYCPDSCQLVCPLCVTSVHQGKTFEELSDAVNRIYSVMEEKLDTMMANNDKVKDLCDNLRKIQTEIHFNSVTKQDQIRRGIETLRNLADEREQNLIDEIQEVETLKLSKLKEQLEKTWEEQQNLKRLGEEAMSALGTTKPTSLLHQIKLLDKWCAQDLDDIEDEMDQTIEEFLHEEPCVTSDIGKTLPTYKKGLPLKPTELRLLDFESREEDEAPEVEEEESAASEEDMLHEEEMARLKAEVEKIKKELAETQERQAKLDEEKSKKESELDALRQM